MLSKEIMLKYDSIKETDATFAKKMKIKAMLNNEIHKLHAASNVIAFGSTMSLSLEGSDLDLMLMVERQHLDRSHALDILKNISNELKKCILFNSLIYNVVEIHIIPAYVPLVRFKVVMEGAIIGVDLSVKKAPRNNGHIKSALGSPFADTPTLNTHLFMCYNKLFEDSTYPVLKVLALVVKDRAKHHSLIGTRHNYLSSYGLMLMVILLLLVLLQLVQHLFGLKLLELMKFIILVQMLVLVLMTQKHN